LGRRAGDRSRRSSTSHASIGTTLRDFADFGVEVAQPPRTARHVRVTLTDPGEPGHVRQRQITDVQPASSPAHNP
jgi:hypothetical protein